MEGGVETSDSTEQVNESHSNNFEAAVIKLKGGGGKVELNEIINRLAEQVKDVEQVITANKPQYIPSIGTAKEEAIVRLLVSKWAEKHPNELPNIILGDRRKIDDGCFEISYPNRNSIRLDFGFSSSTALDGADYKNNLEWAIEFKKINWAGDTGVDMSERAVGKLCSPFSSTGPILEDALRVCQHTHGKRHAVILLSPDILLSQLEKCKTHSLRNQLWYPDSTDPKYQTNDRFKTLSGTFKKNNDVPFTAKPLLPFVEKIFDYNDIKYSDYVIREISGLSRHPVYSNLTLIGWEIFS